MPSLKDFCRIATAVVLFVATTSLLTLNAFAQLAVSPAVVVFSNTPRGPGLSGS
jgi:hypothetical protein